MLHSVGKSVVVEHCLKTGIFRNERMHLWWNFQARRFQQSR